MLQAPFKDYKTQQLETGAAAKRTNININFVTSYRKLVLSDIFLRVMHTAIMQGARGNCS
jgi:hypothetical protein